MNLSYLKDQYQGKRAFLIGNGKSLNNTPMGSLTQEHTFATNRISKIFDQTFWRPSFYIMTATSMDEWSYESMRETQIANFVWDDHKFRLYDQANDVSRQDNVLYINCSEIDHCDPKDAITDFFSWDIEERISKFGTSLFAAAQIAVYMGFNPIYFVGCDLGDKHFVKDYRTDAEKEKRSEHSLDYWDAGIIAAHRLMDKMSNVKFYNATVGGDLDIHERVDILDLLRGNHD